MKKLWLILAAVLALSLLAPAVLASETDAVEGFATLSAAVEAAEEGAELTLCKSVTEDVTVSKNLCIDLNGCSISGKLTAAEGYTVTVKDSQTNDFDVSDNLYGKVTAISGNVIAADGYLKITETDPETENDYTSFHMLTMTLTDVTVRPDVAGIYYGTSFKGDEVIRNNITAYGVALNVGSAPTQEQVLADTGEKTHVAFGAETWTAKENTAKSLLLEGILKTDNGYMINKRNAGAEVYGAAYVRVGDEVVFGTSADYSLQEVITTADTIWNDLEADQKTGLLDMLENYETLMRSWTMENARAAAAEAYKTRSFKVLTLGHSLAVDAGQMLAKVAKEEGTTDITVATLYYSGCTLQQHYKFMTENTPYRFFYVNTLEAADTAPVYYENTYTMYDALTYTDWDIIIMQNGVFTSGQQNGYDPYLDRIIDYVNQHKTNPKAKLIWNMTWTAPEDADLLATSREVSPGYEDKFQDYFGSSADAMYQGIVDCVRSKIMTHPIYTAIIPSGTAVMNARTSYLEDKDLYRDYIHVNDYGRLLAAYTWYSILTGKKIEAVNMDAIPAALRYYGDDREAGDLVLTDDMKAIIVESVQNAIANPYQVTQSKITTPSA